MSDFKIGILTYHRSHNYGAFLQSYSLSHALNNIEGIKCELINYNLAREDKVYKKKKYKRPIYFFAYLKQDRMFEKMQEKQLLSGELLLDDGYEKVLKYAEENYDAIVVGSDEIWRIASRGFPNAYWIPGNMTAKKISYAASGRIPESKLSEDRKAKLKEYYSDFDYIGVRDVCTKNLVQYLCPEKEVNINCDPAFLYSDYRKKQELKDELASKWKLSGKKKTVGIIYDRVEVIKELRSRLGNEFQFVTLTRPMWNASKNLCSVSPFEWADIIGGCDFVVTSYFHGMLFATNQNTPFVAIDRRADRSNLDTSKLYDFLSNNNLEERYFISSELDDTSWDKIAESIRKESANGVDFTQVVSKQRRTFDDFAIKLGKILDNQEISRQ